MGAGTDLNLNKIWRLLINIPHESTVNTNTIIDAVCGLLVKIDI